MSTAIWRLMPDTFLPASSAFLFRTIGVLHALRIDDDKARRGVSSQFESGLSNHFFKACSKTLMSSWVGSRHFSK